MIMIMVFNCSIQDLITGILVLLSEYDEIEALKSQSMQVSIISVANFAARIAAGAFQSLRVHLFNLFPVF